MRIDSKKVSDAKTVALCVLFFPAVAASIIHFLIKARKQLTFPNKDMWE